MQSYLAFFFSSPQVGGNWSFKVHLEGSFQLVHISAKVVASQKLDFRITSCIVADGASKVLVFSFFYLLAAVFIIFFFYLQAQVGFENVLSIKVSLLCNSLNLNRDVMRDIRLILRVMRDIRLILRVIRESFYASHSTRDILRDGLRASHFTRILYAPQFFLHNREI